MSGRRAIVGLCMLCALVFSAVIAQAAQAITGTTAFTCIDSGTGPLWGEHCLASNPGHGETQGWEHVAITEGEKTHGRVTNEKTGTGTVGAEPGFLRTVVGGVAIKLKVTEVLSTGWMENSKEASGEHYAHGSGTTTYSHVTVVEPEHCKVEGVTAPGGPEMVTTKPLVATSKGQGMDVLIAPETGTTFTEFALVNNGGTCAAAQPTVVIAGTVRGQPDEPGGTITYNEATVTTEGTLHFGGIHGPTVGIEVKTTGKAGKEPETEPTHPISGTTVTT